jgi:hypothetical protein
MTTETKTKVIVNCETGETQTIPLTVEELAQLEIDAAQGAERIAQEQAEAEAKAAAKASAEAKLTALGLTPEEIAALR